MPKITRHGGPTIKTMSYPVGLLPEESTVEEEEAVIPSPPSLRANRQAWADYAEAIGVEGVTSRHTKAAIVAKVT